jgi:hypothetical protein
MKIVECTVTASVIRLRLTNDDLAGGSIEIEAPLPKVLDYGSEIGREGRPLGDIQLAALRHARTAIDAEIKRLSELGGRRSKDRD